MFKKGSYVTYRSEGVCVISDIRTESFAGAEEEYYILAPVNDMKSTVFVPVGNATLTGYMRPLLDASELSLIVDSLRTERLDWIPENRARNTVFKQIISVGDRKELIVLLNTLYDRLDSLAAEGKKAGTMDISILARAERLIYEELSATTNIGSQAKIKPLLRGELTLESKEK